MTIIQQNHVVKEAWRPYNETPDDLRRERDAGEILAKAWRCTPVKLSVKLYSFDFALCRNKKVLAFAEFKARGKDYPDYLLSCAKYSAARQLNSVFGLPLLFVIQTPSALQYIDIATATPDRVELGGNARGQNGDIEPCVFFLASQFKKVGGA